MPDSPALDDPRLDGVEHEVVRHGRVTSLEEAAAIRGVEPAAIIKTMVVRRAEDDHVFVLVPGDRVIDWAKLREHLGERRLSLADADEALAVTGYAPGTITPFGALRALPVIIDTEASERTVSIGGGAHGVSITIAGPDVTRVLDAEIVDVTRPRG